MKVVFDTNVFISGILWPGTCNELIVLAETKSIEVCCTPKLLTELKCVLNRPKFHSRLNNLKTTPNELISLVINLVFFYPDLLIKPVIKEDIADNRVLSCALASNSEYIITGDIHLLNLHNYKNIEILTPGSFIQIIF
jgi:putative PIN family toxin of toxin-antitoxin system